MPTKLLRVGRDVLPGPFANEGDVVEMQTDVQGLDPRPGCLLVLQLRSGVHIVPGHLRERLEGAEVLGVVIAVRPRPRQVLNVPLRTPELPL